MYTYHKPFKVWVLKGVLIYTSQWPTHVSGEMRIYNGIFGAHSISSDKPGC